MILNISAYQVFHIDVTRMISWLGFRLQPYIFTEEN